MKIKKRYLILIAFCLLSVLIFAFVLFRNHSANLPQPAEKQYNPKYVYYGTYPQSQVQDEELLKKLNQLALQWQSYGYYNGDGALGSARPTDCMLYADVDFEGEMYRAVQFSEYRSFCCHLSPDGTSWQPLDFELNTVYWYRYEPIRWVVLSETEHLLMSEKVLDAQPINSVIYAKKPEQGFDAPEFYKDAGFTTFATDYYTSDLRVWLDTTFFETAFSEKEAEHIIYSELDNSAWSKRYKKYDSKNSSDRVFLLSYDEMTNPEYGFSKQAEKEDALRVGYATDYAICQGVSTIRDGFNFGPTWWWLRTVGKSSSMNLGINFHGAIQFSLTTTYSPDCADTGIRPAIRLDSLTSEIR